VACWCDRQGGPSSGEEARDSVGRKPRVIASRPIQSAFRLGPVSSCGQPRDLRTNASIDAEFITMSVSFATHAITNTFADHFMFSMLVGCLWECAQVIWRRRLTWRQLL
jgi:hypothetical protein